MIRLDYESRGKPPTPGDWFRLLWPWSIVVAIIVWVYYHP
jgi:hypothetical protein